MKALVYVNPQKDPQGLCVNNLIQCFNEFGVSYEYADVNSEKSEQADALFVLGGDGTILSVVDYALKNNLSIVGINVGKLGFLTEFERDEISEAVKLFSQNSLKKEFRTLINANFNGKNYSALNEVFVQRMYRKEGGSIITLDVSFNGEFVDKITGDGVICSTPTGCSAYSLSAGGALVNLDCNAFQINPIAAHSISHRPIIYNADNVCNINLRGGEDAGLFIDGRYIDKLNNGDQIILGKSEKSLCFLRANEYSFFKRLNTKLKIGVSEK